MDTNTINNIANKLNEVKANKPCSRCGNLSHSIAGNGLIGIQDDPNIIQMGGPSIPTIIIVCENCGLVSHHAKGVLKV